MLLLLIIILVMSLWFYSWKKLQFFSSHGVKTLRPVPLLGNLANVTLQREFIDNCTEKGYKAFKDERFFGMYQFLVPTVIVRDLNLVRQVTVRDYNAFYDRGMHVGIDCDPMFGRNLIMLKGSRWRIMRAALSPAFSSSRCRCMIPLMANSAKSVTEYLRDRTTKGHPMDVNDISLAYMNDVITSCAFGLEVNSLKDPNNEIYQLSKKAILEDSMQMIKLFLYENMKPVLKVLKVKIIKTCHAEQFSQLFKSILKARREDTSTSRPDIIQTLINSTQEISDDDHVAQAVSFFSAGYDTTAALINYFLVEMAANPQVQERLQAELDNMTEGENMYDQIQSLEYLDMCLSGSRFAILAAKIFLAEFFKEYSTRTPKLLNLKLCPSAFVLRPKDGFKVIIEPRNQ